MSSLAALSEDEQFAVQRFNGLGMVSREGVTEANVGALLEKIDGKRSSLFLFHTLREGTDTCTKHRRS